VFPVFALMMRYVMLDEYWFNAKFFTQYIFIKGPLTAVASALFSFLTVLALKPLVKNYTNISAQKPYIINGALGVVIIAIWLIGFFSV
ncbi:MAG: hypothetical protein PHR81_11685, partial [Bacteroidales bacterium]|nr:hypothetical protein [Bacteroidales bacterium]